MRQKKENKTNIIKTKKELVFFLTFFLENRTIYFCKCSFKIEKKNQKLTEYENVVQFKMHSSLICSIKTLNVFLKS